MTLVPITESIAIIAKLEEESPDAARALMVHGLYESLQDQIDDNRHWLEPALLVEVAKINLQAREGLVRYSVAKALETGELVGETEAAYLEMVNDYVVAKLDLVGTMKDRWEKLHPRGQDGRFVRAGSFTPTGPTRSMTQNASHDEVRAKVKALQKQKLLKPDTKLLLHVSTVDAGGQLYGPEEGAGSNIPTTPEKLEEHLSRMATDAPKHAVTGISVQRKHMPSMSPKEQAALDISGLLTGGDFGANRAMVNRLKETDLVKDPTKAATDWNAPSAGGPGQDRQAYRRMQLTGQMLSAASTPGSLTSSAGGMIQLAGSIGPEAEKILGPGIRRAAYRYRGTERRPDKDMVESVARSRQIAESGVDLPERAGGAPAYYDVGRRWVDQRYSDDQRDMGAAGDAVAARMLGVDGHAPMIPNQRLTELSQASGETPPSQGVMIDADGDVVSQAMGFNGDHYLPFDLRNLKELNGGQYIRTRAVGGPTSEDIYTGLMTGTRQLQVVSNSGVFTLEFDPDLRGGRRFGDKARRMVSRYQEMLETIDSEGSKLYERDVSPEKKAELKVKAAEDAETDKEFSETYNRLLERERMRGRQVTPEDDEANLREATTAAEERIAEDYKNVSYNDMPKTHQSRARIKEQYVAEEMERLNAGAVRRLQLDGAGYDRAMKALQQEFPYFIRRAEWESLPDWHKSRGIRNRNEYSRVGAKDLGHVQRGQTNAAIGLQGANARRKVGRVGAKAEQEPTETTTQRGPNGATTTDTNRPAAGRKAPLTQAAVMSESSPFRRTLDREADRIVDAALGVAPQGGALAADLNPDIETSAVQLNYWAARAREKGGAGREGRAFVNWLLNDATPERRLAVMNGLKDLPALVDKAPPGEYDPEAAAKVAPAVSTLNEMISLIEPYAEVPNGKPEHMTEPNEKLPKPPKFDDMLDIYGDEEALAKQARKVGMENELSEKYLTKLSGLDDKDRAKFVQEKWDSFDRAQNPGDDIHVKREKELLAAQRVWSALHTKEMAERLRVYMPSDGDPKVGKALRFESRQGQSTLSKSTSTSRPSRVVVHKLDDQFSRRMRARLGLPEPSSV